MFFLLSAWSRRALDVPQDGNQSGAFGVADAALGGEKANQARQEASKQVFKYRYTEFKYVCFAFLLTCILTFNDIYISMYIKYAFLWINYNHIGLYIVYTPILYVFIFVCVILCWNWREEMAKDAC